MTKNWYGRAALFCTFILFVLFAAFGCASKEEKKADHLAKAREYAEKGEYRKAVIEFKNVIQLDPENGEAHYELGEAYLKLKQGREAFQSFARAVSINEDNLDAQLKMGQIYLLGKKTEEARKKAEFILKRAPDNFDALTLLSGVQVQERNIEGAIGTLKTAISKDPERFLSHLSLARLYVLKGDLDQAETSYRKAISLDPKSRVPYVELAQIYARKGDMVKAEDALKKMVAASGAEYQNLYVLARFYENTKNDDAAQKTYQKAVDMRPEDDVTPLINLARYYARRDEYSKALALMEQASAVKKEDLNIRLGIAQLQFDFKKTAEAEKTVDEVLAKDKGNIGANFLKGRIYLLRNQFADALERFDHIVREKPDDASAYYFKALSLIGKGEKKLSEQSLVKAVELNPRLLDARMILAEFYIRDGNKELAREQIDRVLEVVPKSTKALTLKGNLNLLEKNLKGAEEAFAQVVEIDPNYAPGYVRLGRLYSLEKRDRDALEQFEKALSINPGQTDALAIMVGIYLKDKRYADALQVCERQRKKMGGGDRESAVVDYLQGNVFQAKGDAKQAREHFERAIEADPNLPAPYVALARIYVQEGKPQEAISQYKAVVSKNPNYLAGYMALGAIYDQQGNHAEAEAFYRKALEIRKDFAPAANNLAWNLAANGGNIDEALGYARTAKEQMPKSAAVMDTLGWIYYLKGSYLNAIAEFQDSLSRDPDNPVINYHLGMAYYKNGQPEKAREPLQRALEIQRDFRGAEEAGRVLEEIGREKPAG